MTAIRPAAVAGAFYPAEPARLSQAVRAHLQRAAPASVHPKALIVPHAGYVYSGGVAAAAYAALAPLRHTLRRVVLLGPTHRVAVRGLALPASDAFATPLGVVPLDQAGMAALAGLPQVVVSDAAHAAEHSLEVQLPFLQTMLADFTLLPLAVGQASAEDVAEVLERVWGGDETLIVISSDLSHYLPYEVAQQIDRHTVEGLLKLRPVPSHEEACGATPVNGLILAARRHHLAPHLLDLKNSGDTAGPRDGVVGYAALAFEETPKEPLIKSHMAAHRALRDGMQGGRGSEWCIPFATSPTPQTARKARAHQGCGQIARPLRCAPRHRSPSYDLRRAPCDQPAGRRTPRSGGPERSEGLAAGQQHRDFPGNAAHGGLNQRFPDADQ